MLRVLILSKGLESTPTERFFAKLFMEIFIYSKGFCQKSAEKAAAYEIVFTFVLDRDIWADLLYYNAVIFIQIFVFPSLIRI